MPMYHFHTEDAFDHRDDEGTFCASDAAAQDAAISMMGDLLKHGARQFWDVGTVRMTVVDPTGLVLFVIDTTGIVSPSANVQRSPKA